MDFLRLIKQAKLFNLKASSSLKLTEILKQLDQLETFKDRIEYAEKHLDHLSSGSSRIVLTDSDHQTVIKLAKNEKGIAQNETEAQLKDIKSPYFNHVNNASTKSLWIQVPYLDKITVKQFEEMTDLNFEDFGKALDYGLQKLSSNSLDKPKSFSEIEESDIYQQVVKVAKQLHLLPGDLSRISSWGTRDHKVPVLIDAGLTREVFDDYYDKSSSSGKTSKAISS